MRPTSSTPIRRHVHAASLLVLLCAAPAFAQIPAGYYDTVDASTPASLRQTLHALIDDHVKFPYTASGTDTWDILELADEDPSQSTRILDVYKNASYAKQGGGNTFYDREHSWPSSYGFPDNDAGNVPFTDCHLLFLCDVGYNASRGNKPFRPCASLCQELATEANAGQGGQGGGYPGDSNWTAGFLTAGTFEVWMGRRGDVARALLYADVRYEGGVHAGLGVAEPDLILTDSEALIAASNTGSNLAVAYMGMLQTLLLWHVQDPVDARERDRNDVIYAFQGNRNPFVDHPEWAACVFQAACASDVQPPAVPVGLQAVAGDALVALDWSDNVEPDLAGYRVYRAQGAGSLLEIGGGLVFTSAYVDASAQNGLTYAYAVTAEDLTGNESVASASVLATPQAGGPAATPWINELHYDNVGADAGEFVEIAGLAGTNLDGWSLVGYNGNGGGVYKTVALTGALPNQQNGFGTLVFAFSDLQNGAPDGVALIDAMGAVVEFVSYEGPFVASDGPAQGMNALDIGVSETSATPVGFSLQLGGSGDQAADFAWQGEHAETPGLVNANQTFAPPRTCQADLGFGSHATAVLAVCGGDLSTGNDATLTMTGLPVAAQLFLCVGLQANPTPLFELGGASLVPVPVVLLLNLPNPGTGMIALPVPGGGGPFSIYLQAVIASAGSAHTSNALKVTVLP